MQWRRGAGAVGLVLAVSVLSPAPVQADVPVPVGGSELISSPGRLAAGATVAANAAGLSAAVWREYDGPGVVRPMIALRPADGPWSGPIPVADPLPVLHHVDVVVTDAGVATVAWTQQDADGIHRLMARDLAPSGTWGTARTITEEPIGIFQLDGNARGDASIGWVSQSGVSAAVRPANGTWGAVQRVGDTPYADLRLVIDPLGNATAIWLSGGELLASTRPAGAAAWPGSATRLATPTTDIDLGPAVVGADGRVVVAWIWKDSSVSVLQVSSRSWGGSWTAPFNASGSAPATTPLVAIGPDGNVMVAWRRRLSPYPIQSRVLPAGGGWSPIIGVVAAAEDATQVRVALLPGGRQVIHWLEHVTGDNDRVMFASTPLGQPWPAAGQIASSAQASALAADGAGNAVLVMDHAISQSRTVRALGLDGAAPVLTGVELPAAVAGEPARLIASAYDAWSSPIEVAWDLGDGMTATGESIEHVWAEPGTYPVGVVVRDALGRRTARLHEVVVVPRADPASPTPTATPSPTVGPTATPTDAPPTTAPTTVSVPRITGVSLRPRSIEISSPQGRRTRTTLRFTLSEAATVRLRIKRRGARRPALALVRQFEAGPARWRLTARLGGRRLAPGTYRVTVSARDGDGASTPRRVRLVVRR